MNAGMTSVARVVGSGLGRLSSLLSSRPWWAVTGGLIAVGGFVVAFADDVSDRVACLVGYLLLQFSALLGRRANTRNSWRAAAAVPAVVGALLWAGVGYALVREYINHPHVMVDPDHGDHTTLFHGKGSGFTPHGSVTVSARMPSGADYRRTFPLTADGDGNLTWSWQWESGDADGVWSIHFLDQASGRSTSVQVTITGEEGTSDRTSGRISPTPRAVRPSVSVAPATGGHATLFAGTASGFTPHGSVTVSATMPNGKPYPTTFPKTADDGGAFTWSWQWDIGDADGTWTIAFLDHTTRRTATIDLTISGAPERPTVSRQPSSTPTATPTSRGSSSPGLAPHVAVLPLVGNHSTLFTGTGSGFTPGGSVTVSATMPDGTPYPTTFPKRAESNGAFTWSWQWDVGDADGVWTIAFLDHASGRSTTVGLTIHG
jgi:hypothetical protein